MLSKTPDRRFGRGRRASCGIFQLYLELGSLNLLMKELRKRGIRTKVQQLKSGRMIGGIPFTRGPLSYLLRNRFFVGDVVYKGETLPGPQPPILRSSTVRCRPGEAGRTTQQSHSDPTKI